MTHHTLKAFCFSLALLSACSANGKPASDVPFVQKEVARFANPWAMTFFGSKSSDALVTEKAGLLFLVDTKTGRKTAITGLPKVAEGGQGGFGDVLFHPLAWSHPASPHFGTVYLSWVEAGAGGFGAVVAKARLIMDKEPELADLNIIWRQAPKVSGRGHFGHRIAFGPDGKLYISSGERQKFDPAQDMSGNLGKVVRLNDDGSVPADNPFTTKGGVTAQIWSLGHRNPLGLAFDPGGRLWNSEMGPANGDELNLVKRGANYGYPKVSNGSHYDGRDIPDHSPADGFEAPKAWWDPAISPGSLMIYSGKLFPGWTGDAFIGGLGGEALVRVDLDGESAKKADHWAMGFRVREVEQGPDGAIWLLEDGDSGRLLKLTPKE